jgi:S-methylmethionine-dependent homocysteine/selenocysteine methylase
MTLYRSRLPLRDGLFLTDGGLETVLIFQEGIELASFAAIDLMRRPDGPEILKAYFKPYLDIAKSAWAEPIGFADLAELADANKRGLELADQIRTANATPDMPIVVSGCIGPRGDGYDPVHLMSAEAAENYHAWQIGIFAAGPADLVSAITMNNVNEAIGIARAARAHAMPVVISFTVETDGNLPTGDSLGEAIMAVDTDTGAYPVYYMINCAHPDHFAETLAGAEAWRDRLGGIRANASKRSHAELDCASDLDDGDPVELGRELAELRKRFPQLTVLGGCCGTDHRHIEEIARAAGTPSLA